MDESSERNFSISLPFLPIIGTIIGAVVGAGAGALALQLTKIDVEATKREHMGKAGRVAIGAATGRLVSTFVKAGIAIAMGAVLITAAVVS